MRLINTRTGSLEEFMGQGTPIYAILSHTWGDEEVTYQDYMRGTHKAKKGYRKIQKVCEIAAEARISYAWVDTCCIDKKSSAELSEAINSMYRWYHQSKVCYAYLSDLSGEADVKESLGNCRWFSRGWTLQELIAPKIVCFYDARWKIRGFKTTLADQLSTITNIDNSVLRNESPLSKFSVAQKLAWAARRKTTRLEDSAYCLLGLLDLNMPLLYGEGEKAFRRLQDEIIRSTADLSILAWKFNELTRKEDKVSLHDRTRASTTMLPYPSKTPGDDLLCGVLSRSPAGFLGCSKYMSIQPAGLKEFSVTNIGIKIRARVLLRQLGGKGAMGYILPLNCTLNGRSLGLHLRQIGHDEYLRENPFDLFEFDDSSLYNARPAERHLLTALPKEIFPTSLSEYRTRVLPSRRTHILRIEPQNEMAPINPWPADRYDYQDQLFFVYQDLLRDFGVIDISILLKSPNNQIGGSKWVRCKFCALGWSSRKAEEVQLGIFEENEHAQTFRVIQNQMSDWDHESRFLAYYLNQYKIPKCTAVSFALPQIGRLGQVTFTAKLEKDENISLNPFWTIQFSYKLWLPGTEPSIEKKSWTQD